jgi:hypothetical protein
VDRHRGGGCRCGGGRCRYRGGRQRPRHRDRHAGLLVDHGARAARDRPRDPVAIDHGPGETLLTGTTAEKVRAAAQAAAPGGTIIRVETDSAGSPYEAHVRKSDGTEVTLKIDSSFKVTSTESGFGRGPGGGHR